MAIIPVNAINNGLSTSSVDWLTNITKGSNSNAVNKTSDGQSFQSILDSIVKNINETNELTNKAEEEEIKYAMGEDNTLELMVAQNKANISLSYTVAVRDKIMEAYKEIMNMQF
ncbi:MAG: flagellar hook-basal body complex protein FliE [Lachnospiraceae bacterium]|nr:flagellar hook-basal body complex protein FliE [Lachnospiraceae bacterium]